MLEAKMLNLAITDKGFSIILKTDKDDKVVAISVATIEAQSVIIGFLEFKQNRPLSHDLLKNVIEVYDINLKHIIIDGLKGDVFISKIVLEKGDNLTYIDSRPSDAIALALRMKSKIFIDETVVDACGMVIDDIGNISLNNQVPFKYTNLDDIVSMDENDIIDASNAIFKKYSNSEKDDGSSHMFDNNVNTADDKLKHRQNLQRLLEQAIKEERYEDAANYRDELGKSENS